MSEPTDDGQEVPREVKGGGSARRLLWFLAAAGLASAGLWGYVRLGAGAAGLGGLLVLVAPAVVIAGLLASKLKGGVRAGWLSLLFGLALPYLLVSCQLSEWAGRQSFDSATWKAAAGGRTEDRIRQVDDLLASGALDRSNRGAVRALLGPDDSADGTGWGSGYFASWDSVYWLGSDRRWMGIDSEWLVLRFGADGSVADYRVVQD